MVSKFVGGLNLRAVKVISLDVTGTLLVHRNPIANTYSKCAFDVGLRNPPTASQMKQPFKDAYYKTCIDYPFFGEGSKMSNRDWWKICVETALINTGRTAYTTNEFNKYFRRVYQHFGGTDAYDVLGDAKRFLEFTSSYSEKSNSNVVSPLHYLLGVTTNAPYRTIETVLPMLKLDHYFDWFVCSQEVLAEKPHSKIFDETFRQACLWKPTLQRHEVLHIGDALVADYCGARAAGFQAILIDRSDEPKVATYQDWLTSPDYPGKAEDDRNLPLCTVKSLDTVREMLLKAHSHE